MTHRVALHVNVDHVATLRQARRIDYPDPVEAAAVAEAAGACGITIHLHGFEDIGLATPEQDDAHVAVW